MPQRHSPTTGRFISSSSARGAAKTSTKAVSAMKAAGAGVGAAVPHGSKNSPFSKSGHFDRQTSKVKSYMKGWEGQSAAHTMAIGLRGYTKASDAGRAARSRVVQQYKSISAKHGHGAARTALKRARASLSMMPGFKGKENA